MMATPCQACASRTAARPGPLVASQFTGGTVPWVYQWRRSTCMPTGCVAACCPLRAKCVLAVVQYTRCTMPWACQWCRCTRPAPGGTIEGEMQRGMPVLVALGHMMQCALPMATMLEYVSSHFGRARCLAPCYTTAREGGGTISPTLKWEPSSVPSRVGEVEGAQPAEICPTEQLDWEAIYPSICPSIWGSTDESGDGGAHPICTTVWIRCAVRDGKEEGMERRGTWNREELPFRREERKMERGWSGDDDGAERKMENPSHASGTSTHDAVCLADGDGTGARA